ncbi:hypothetical protein [Streptomyces sp. NPDC056817]|uniref:hypothetical protein n=1 Tax=Streptomyces sp. NPDC056817 TaxID=3345950 RepID=UPI00367B0E80
MDSLVGQLIVATDPETGRVIASGICTEQTSDGDAVQLSVQQYPIFYPEVAVMDLHAWITAQVTQVERLLDENEWPPSQAEGVRLRCEADRRILARHRSVDGGYSVACAGCGYDGSYCPEPVTENLNDCPELLDLAHAHGITPEVLAWLDRPQPPERSRPEPSPIGRAVADVWGGALLGSLKATPIGDVPATLRGPNWKADTP